MTIELLDRDLLHERFRARQLDVAVCPADQLPDDQANQIVLKSRQTHILEHEGQEDVGTEEAPGRFRGQANFIEWAQKGRLMYLPVDMSVHPEDNDAPDIGGVVWFGERYHDRVPESTMTFAIRLYVDDEENNWGSYRQTGLGGPLMQAAHNDLPHRVEESRIGTGIGLDLVEGNEPAEALYIKNGYVEVDRYEDLDHGGQRRILMENMSALAIGVGQA